MFYLITQSDKIATLCLLLHKPYENVVAQERHESENDDGDAEQDNHIALTLCEAERIEVVVGLIDPSALDELQVVEQCDNVVQNGESYKRIMPCRCPAEEQMELAKEPGERRNACQAEHRNGKRNG